MQQEISPTISSSTFSGVTWIGLATSIAIIAPKMKPLTLLYVDQTISLTPSPLPANAVYKINKMERLRQ